MSTEDDKWESAPMTCPMNPENLDECEACT